MLAVQTNARSFGWSDDEEDEDDDDENEDEDDDDVVNINGIGARGPESLGGSHQDDENENEKTNFSSNASKSTNFDVPADLMDKYDFAEPAYGVRRLYQSIFDQISGRGKKNTVPDKDEAGTNSNLDHQSTHEFNHDSFNSGGSKEIFREQKN
ncbi:unnamed protein product [Protopolystoma xenopodis]|uniref:Uncharacterized protein n=1 Tax=Protopolystoma xenopodis TaxID=117903 RepID=A0A448WUK0_9PLAT|nr:unnamed protein product [Protopolystoma xenopodis]